MNHWRSTIDPTIGDVKTDRHLWTDSEEGALANVLGAVVCNAGYKNRMPHECQHWNVSLFLSFSVIQIK